jgi:cytochrome P450
MVGAHSTVAVQGTMLVVLPYVMHRLPKYWGDDAGDFKPERFLHKDAAGSTPGAAFGFLPFLAGPRSCIGSRFAVLEMKVP